MVWDPWSALEAQPTIHCLWHRLPHALGVWMHQHSTIVLNPDQTVVNARATLAEELGHAALDHRPTANPIEAERQELRAKRWAAVRIVELADLAEAMAAAPSWFDVAETLDVDPELLEIRVAGLTDAERRELMGRVARKELWL